MKNKKGVKADYNVTLLEACKILNVSSRTATRYIKNRWLKPKRTVSERGTLQYRFNRADLTKFKKPDRTERTKKTRHENDIIALLTEQLKIKDKQIKELLERSRETNIMFNRLQNQLLLTEGKKEERVDKEDKADKKGQGISGWLKRLFKGE